MSILAADYYKFITKHKKTLASVSISVALVVAIFITTFSTLLKNKTNGIFYSIDPDMVYMANALLYIKSGIIAYIDHPGTVSISALSISFLPIRFFVKLILGQNFIEWSFFNFEILTLYSRIFQSLLFSAGIFVFLRTLDGVAKSVLSQILGLLLLLLFLPIYYIGSSISSEAVTFLIAALWIFYFAKGYKNEFKNINTISFLGGLMVASRATAFVYVLAALLTLLNKLKYKINLNKMLVSLGFISIGFVVGLYPLKQHVIDVLKRVVFFATSSGVHGAVIDSTNVFGNYLTSLKTFFYRDPAFCVIVAITLGLSLKRMANNKNDILGQLGLLFFAGILLYAKFPLAHYQTFNYLFLCYLFVVFTSKLSRPYKYIIIVITTIAVLPVFKTFNINLNQAIVMSSNLDKHVDLLAKEGTVVWEWARSTDFAKIWIRDWGGGIYDDYLSTSRIFSLTSGMKEVRVSASLARPISNFCESTFMIQESSLRTFLSTNQSMGPYVNRLNGTENMYAVNFTKCLK